MFIGRIHKDGLRKDQPKEKNQMTTFNFNMNLELNALNPHEIQYKIDMEHDTMLIYYQGEIRIICLSEMRVERIIENISQRIHSVGVYDGGVYAVTSNRRDFYITLYDRDGVSEPYPIVLDSRILAHTIIEKEFGSLIAVICADNMLRVYEVASGSKFTEKHIGCLNRIAYDTVEMHLLNNSEWICMVLNNSTIVFISTLDWHATYPISGEISNIEYVCEFNNAFNYCAFVWEKPNNGSSLKKEINKNLSLIKMPPENENGTYDLEHHNIPGTTNFEVLDCVAEAKSIFLLLKTEGRTILIQFMADSPEGYSFSKIGSFHDSKHQFIMARIVPDTCLYNPITKEVNANVHFIFPRCLSIGVYEY